jgi:hypothetical protein
VNEFSLVVTEEAERDITEVRDRYRSIGPELDASFRAALDDAVVAIRIRPYAYQVVHRSLRRILLRRFAYFILFANSIQSANEHTHSTCDRASILQGANPDYS